MKKLEGSSKGIFFIILLSGIFAIGFLGTNYGLKLYQVNPQQFSGPENQTIYVQSKNDWNIFLSLRFNVYLDSNRILVANKFQFLGLNIKDQFLIDIITFYGIDKIQMNNGSYFIFFTRTLYPFPGMITYDYLFNKNGQWFIMWDIPEYAVNNGMPHQLLLDILCNMTNSLYGK